MKEELVQDNILSNISLGQLCRLWPCEDLELSDLPTSSHACGRLKADIYWWSLVLKKRAQVGPLCCNIMSLKATAQRACIFVTVAGLNVQFLSNIASNKSITSLVCFWGKAVVYHSLLPGRLSATSLQDLYNSRTLRHAVRLAKIVRSGWPHIKTLFLSLILYLSCLNTYCIPSASLSIYVHNTLKQTPCMWKHTWQ